MPTEKRSEGTEGSRRLRLRLAERRDQRFIHSLATSELGTYGPHVSELAAVALCPVVSTIVAEMDGRRVGFVIFRHAEGQADLGAIAVVPKARNMAVGEAMVRYVLEAARREGDSRTYCCVAEGNAAARRLFERCGFELVRQAGSYPAGQIALEYEFQQPKTTEALQ